MTDRFGLGLDGSMEEALADLGSAVAWPATPDLAPAVGAAIRSSGRPLASVPGRRPRTVRRALLIAAALALLVVGAAAAVRLGLDLLEIRIGPIPSASAPATTASAGPSASAARLGLGKSVPLDDARSTAGFPVAVPPGLGAPAGVFIGGPEVRGQVAFLYAATDDLPPSDLLDGAGLLITQGRGRPDQGLARKLVDAGLASMESVTIDGSDGYWIHGQPHVFWYLAPDGTAIEDSRRLVGDTLVWERDGILYRIEGAIGRDQAIRIAESMMGPGAQPSASGP